MQIQPRMEENRDQYIQEYFELVKQLNSANKLKDQKTEVCFIISADSDESKLYAAISESQKIYLCYKNKMDLWKPGNVSGYPMLERFLCKTLHMKNNQQIELTEFIKSHLFKFG